MAKSKYKTVGIIGGMGPEATVELMRRVIELTPAKDDCDHIHMLVDNNPKVPSRIKALIDGDGESPVPTLINMALGLEKSGADYLVMPCHTAHHYYSEIADSVSIPFINLIELTALHIKSEFPNVKKVGLLASTAVVNIKLYENAFAIYGIEIIYPDEHQQDTLMTIIKMAKSNSVKDSEINSIKEIANSLDADILVIACTELSVLFDQLDVDTPDVIDALDMLALEIVQKAS